MPKITIDGTTIEVEQGTTVIQAAEQLGIEIPRYCYHPGLTIVGVCRICLVEIERMPKLQVACYTPVTDGMVVHTNSEKARVARQAVLEFLLINHPLDCPVCDQAGECWLQNFYMEHGLYESQMYENKVKKHKALPIGPNVILDSERCILCSRCVRFSDEISKSHELGIFNRGDHSELMLQPGFELDNPYSGNNIDICPVGALTDRDFRFRTRVWYLNETKSICPGCSMGCNIYVHHNDSRTYKADGIRVSRLKPRYNEFVNEWWICDAGRYGFTHVDGDDRIRSPIKQAGDSNELSWEESLDAISRQLTTIIQRDGSDAVAVIFSPKMTNEDLFAGRKLFIEQMGLTHVGFEVTPHEEPFSDNFLIKADKNPNTAGASLLFGDSEQSVATILKKVTEGKIKALFVCHHDLSRGFEYTQIEETMRELELSVFIGSNANSTSMLAQYLLPAAAFVEKEGTYVNYQGRLQRINQAVAPLGSSEPEWRIFRRLSRALEQSLAYFETADVFDDMASKIHYFSGLRFKSIGDAGVELKSSKAGEEITP